MVKKYREDLQNFSIGYNRKKPTRAISGDIEEAIISELRFEEDLVKDKNIPLRSL